MVPKKGKKKSSEQRLCVGKYPVDLRGQKIMGRVVVDHRKGRGSDIIAGYSRGWQNSTCERTTPKELLLVVVSHK